MHPGCSLLLFFLAVTADPEDAVPDRGRLGEMLRDLRAPIRDYECLYEGQEMRLQSLDTSWMPKEIRQATENDGSFGKGSLTTYQGSYAFRDDMSLHLDLSERNPSAKVTASRLVFNLFRGESGQRPLGVEHGQPLGPDSKKRGGTISLKKPHSFLFLDLFPFLLEQQVLNTRIPHCECLRWEEVEGSNCLVVDVRHPGANGNPRVWGDRFWVDVERGGHVVRYERDEEGHVTSRLEGVRLITTKTEEDKDVWFPVAGILRFYSNGLEATTKPVLEQSFGVITRTLRINGGLPDSRFSLDHGLHPEARKLASEYNAGTRIPERDRPRAAEEDLLRTIQDADVEALRYVAVSPSRRPWILRNLSSLALAACGAGMLVVAFLSRRRIA